MNVTDEITDEVRFEVLRRIGEAGRIVIAGHVGPDDDSIASCISTHYYITEKLKHKGSVTINYPGRRLPRWESFDLYDRVTFTDDLAADIEDADLVIFVDGNQWHRYGLEKTDVPTICIDHHHYEALDFDLNVIDPTAASTTEMIESLFYIEDTLDERVARILLMGIIGDTGMFRFITPKNAQVLITAHRLIMKADLDVQDFLAGYHRRGLNAHPIYSELLANSTIIDVPGWPKCMYSYARQDAIGDANDDNVSEAAHAFVSYALQVETIEWTFVATPRSDDSVKFSFRSLPGTVNVKDLATRMEVGGGHDRAAGGIMDGVSAKEAATKVLEWCKEHDVLKDSL